MAWLCSRLGRGRNSAALWKLCAPVKELGVSTPCWLSQEPSVPPRIAVGFGVMPSRSIAVNTRSTAVRLVSVRESAMLA